MSVADAARTLKEKLERAIEKDRPRDAIELLGQLELLEGDKARWPHRRGDLHRRLGQKREAIEAYDRGVRLYCAEGFIARAVALAKLVVDLDPTRTDVLERVDPAAARRLRPQRPVPLAHAPIDFSARVPTLVAATPPPPPTPSTPPAPADRTLEIEIDLDLSELEVSPRSAGDDDRTADELAHLPAFPLFADTPKDALGVLIGGADLVELEHGRTVVRRGEPAHELYAIVEGAVRVRVPGLAEDALPLLGEGEVFGESCLLEDEPRKADVVVEGRLFALRIPREVLNAAVAKHRGLGDVLFELLTRRLIGNLMQTSPLFSAFDPGTRRELGRLFELQRFSAGHRVLTEGERSAGLYIPLTGALELSSRTSQDKQRLGPGAIVGQHSLFFNQASDVSARSTSEMAVLCLPASSFGRVASQYPPVLAHLAELAAEPSMAETFEGSLLG